MINAYIIVSVSIIVLFLITYILGKKSTPVLSKQERKIIPFSELLPSGIAMSKIPINKILSGVAKNTMYTMNSNKIKYIGIVYGKAKQAEYTKVYSALSWVYFMLGIFVTCMLSYAVSISNSIENERIVLLIGIIVSLVLTVLPYSKLKENAVKKQCQISMEFPVFINKVLLLINAGMTVSAAWKTASIDGKDRNHPLYRELNSVNSEIAGGVSEASALESFAKRLGVKEITRCISYISLNLKKGGSDVVASLNDVVEECFESKKNLAKRRGEKASTSMTFPMVLTLIAIILAIGAPAYLSMGGSI